MAAEWGDLERLVKSQRKRERRIAFLIGVFVAACVGYVVSCFIGNPWEQEEGSRLSRREMRELEARILPTKDDVVAYLDGKTITPTDAGEASGQKVKPLTLKKEAMEAVTIRREDHFFTSAAITLKTDAGSYAIDITINHHPIDGTFMFDSFRVEKAARR